MLNDVIKKYEGILRLKKQENKDVENFFIKELGCEFVPQGVIEFYKKYNGCELNVSRVFSIEEIRNVVKKYFPYFLVGMEIDANESKYVPIGDDRMGGYYVFSSNQEGEEIYFLDHEFPDELMTHSNFEEFLEYNCSLNVDL